MKRSTRHLLFYLGNLVLLILMVQDDVRRLLVDVFGSNLGGHLYKFMRTNVEGPVSAIFVAVYFDLVLGRERYRASDPT